MPPAIARFDTSVPPPRDLVQISAQDRRRVSGPGLRAFRALADNWDLDEGARRTLLGDPPRSTYHAWMKRAAQGGEISLPLDTLLRISALLGVHKALTILFVQKAEALKWLDGPHAGLPFAGRSPLELMLDGTQDGILAVRRHLDGWRGGLPGGPAGDTDPVRPEDIVWI